MLRSVQKRVRSIKRQTKVSKRLKSAQIDEISPKNGWDQLKMTWSRISIHKLTLLMTFVYVLCESTRRVRRQDWFHCISKIYTYWVIELLMDFPRCSQEAILELILKAKFKFQPYISLTPRQVATDIWNQKPGNLTIWIMYWRCTCPPLNRYMMQ